MSPDRLGPFGVSRPRSDHAATSYGAHQEAAAARLVLLLRDSPEPQEVRGPGGVAQLVGCRRAVIDALRDRLEHLGSNRAHAPALSPEKTLGIAAMVSQPARALDQVASRLPRASGTGALAPIDALAVPSRDPEVELWRGAAVELTAGTHSLSTATTQPWLEDPGAAWHLLGDTARALEAVVVLDVALGRTGVLADDERLSAASQSRRDWSRAEQRMVTSQVARAAGWYASSTGPDLATPTSTSRSVVRGPWEPMRELNDVAGGQRQLANLIQAPRERDSFASTLRSMDARTAFSLVRAQQQVCGQLRDICGAEPATAPDLAATFERYRSTYAELLPHIRCLADVEDRGVNQPALMQQHEISTFLGRNLDRAAELSTAELLEVAAGTHGVLRELAHAKRRELDRDAGTLRQADPLRVQPPHRIGRKNPVYRALNAASATPAPAPPLTHWAPLTSRRDLSETLDQTPAGRRPDPYLRGHRARGHGAHGQGPGPASSDPQR